MRSRLLAGGQAVVDVPPMVGRGVSRIDPAGFDGVDRPQNVVDLGPAIDVQKNLAAGTYEQQRRIGFAVLVFEEVGVDRRVEARVVQLDRRVIAALV